MFRERIACCHVAATEVAGRLTANLVSGPHQGHMRAFIHRVSGATAASKNPGYNESITAQAIAIALSMPEFPLYPACFSPDTKVICTSSPTVEGVRAAFMAAEGMDGPLDIIENPIGFFTYFSYSGFIPDIWKYIGETWTLRALSVKKYATCGYAQGPVNAAISLKKSHDFSVDEIFRNRYLCSNSYLDHGEVIKTSFWSRDYPGKHTLFIHKKCRCSILYGEITGEFYRAGTLAEKAKEIEKLVGRISSIMTGR